MLCNRTKVLTQDMVSKRPGGVKVTGLWEHALVFVCVVVTNKPKKIPAGGYQNIAAIHII